MGGYRPPSVVGLLPDILEVNMFVFGLRVATVMPSSLGKLLTSGVLVVLGSSKQKGCRLKVSGVWGSFEVFELLFPERIFFFFFFCFSQSTGDLHMLDQVDI